MLDRIEEGQIKKGLRFFSCDLNTNSRLYRNQEFLNKYPEFYRLSPTDLGKTLNYIYEENVSCCVEIKNTIYKNDQLIGYTIKFYQDYKSLKRLLKKDISLKKGDCHKVLKAFQMLNEKKLKCRDVHLGNFLINDEQCLVCDLDALIVQNDDKFKYEQVQNAITLCLAYLYRLKFIDVRILLKDNQSFIINGFRINELIRGFDNQNLHDFEKIIAEIDENELEKSRKYLKQKIKQLRLNPYYSKYYGL